MKPSFLLHPPVRLNQPFGGESEVGGGATTRRKFLKRTAGASVASLVAWSLVANSAHATETEGEGSSLFLVCVDAPSKLEIDTVAIPAVDYAFVNPTGPNNAYWRKKVDVLVAIGPFKGAHRPLGAAGFKMTGKVTTTVETGQLSGQQWTGSGGIATRTAEESQTVLGNEDRTLKWRAKEAVSDNLTDSNNQSGSVNGSSLTGGIGFDRGSLKAATAWAGLTGGYTIGFTVGAAPVSLGITYGGTTTTDTLKWGEESLEWGFEVMTYQEKEAFLAQLVQELEGED